MYTDEDLNGAVAAGVMPRDIADAFRRHIAARQGETPADAEHFRLLLGFNDIFVAIAIAIVLVSVGQLGGALHPSVGGGAVAAVSWGLAEYFTRRRRLALPSILLLLGFVGGVGVLGAGLVIPFGAPQVGPGDISVALAVLAGLVTVAAAYAHWRRFMVPITVAAGAVVGLATVVGSTLAAVPSLTASFPALMLACGLTLFALAMAWDASDRERSTRRSDVAFWLHLAAAPAIIHPIFESVGISGPDGGSAAAVAATIIIYMVVALVSLAIDRRAMLVSALAYVLYAMAAVFQQVESTGLHMTLAALVIGSALLMLSAGWRAARRTLVERLPNPVRGLLPAT